MSSSTGTKAECKTAYQRKSENYEAYQKELGQRFEPLIAARNAALPKLCGPQTEGTMSEWRSANQEVVSQYKLCQREVAEKLLVDMEATTATIRKVMEIQKAIDAKDEEIRNWASWSPEELITNFEAGDFDYSILSTKSSEHSRNIDKIITAYKAAQPDLYAPTREVIRRVAYEVHGEACLNPLQSIHWPRHRSEAGCNADVTLSAETAPCKRYTQADPFTTLGPGGFMSR